MNICFVGQKYIIKGSKRNVNCSANRYQPFKFFSSMFSKCVFQKSSCTEEGQLIFANDSTMEDSKCSCDYTKGYNFRIRPRNNRFCLPEQEDCMCYVTPCPMDKVLTSGKSSHKWRIRLILWIQFYIDWQNNECYKLEKNIRHVYIFEVSK